jgi:hypothetical protein
MLLVFIQLIWVGFICRYTQNTLKCFEGTMQFASDLERKQQTELLKDLWKQICIYIIYISNKFIFHIYAILDDIIIYPDLESIYINGWRERGKWFEWFRKSYYHLEEDFYIEGMHWCEFLKIEVLTVHQNPY